ncbi:MAG: ECF transporter S component [Oscillospiraceae bacterium]|nr:ECF transporter S component [Oscillospiraceae bacterium]
MATKVKTVPAQTAVSADHSKTKKIAVLAMLTAVAFIASFFKIPVISFLKFEAKDVFLLLSGFMYGPVAALGCSIAAGLLELPFSSTGVIGMIMNILASAAFACTASLVYRKRRDVVGAAVGSVCAVAAMTVTMLLWNYLISPLYMGVTRAEIVPMLSTVFLPFNLLKAGINATLTLLIYRPFLHVLHLCGYPVSDHLADSKKATVLMCAVSTLLLGACIGVVVYLNTK